MTSARTRCRHVVSGQVQGVGFRPFVYRLARELELTGFVRNTPEGVCIEVEGPPWAVAAFDRRLPAEIPPLARLVGHARQPLPPIGDTDFRIEASAPGHGHAVLISPDIATCPDCLADLRDPANRRYRYPFTNCTNCGPRYTITRRVPYDRATTAMACFPLCPECAAEYADPANRRFHAQPNACPVCGPTVWLADAAGTMLAAGQSAIEALAAALAGGKLAAIKGLGGFHLACDATNEEAVATLRARKHRPNKPLAVMVPDIETAGRIGRISKAARELLTGTARPITLLPSLPGVLASGIGPDTDATGVMLPYTPLHHILLEAYARALPPGHPTALVMTSGNAGGEPICLGNREALRRLSGIAELFLLHNRDILIRTDDSVVRPLDADPVTSWPDRPPVMLLRRARGYVPMPVPLAGPGAPVVGLGPHLKATLCLTKGALAFPSQHIGDLENLETFGFYQEILEHLIGVLQVSPVACVADLHPDYLSTRFALEQTRWPVLRLQHHVAHILAVLAEHQLAEPALGLALDGTGLGEDGTLWGGEGLLVDPVRCTHARLAHFAPIRLPGGEAAVREPWRLALAGLAALGRTAPEASPWPWLAGREAASHLVERMLAKNVNCPVSTSCGRLFDAVSALIGLCPVIDYEGQAAIRLETVQDRLEQGAYACPLDTGRDPAVLDTLPLLAQVADDWQRGETPARIARRFHLGLVAGLTAMARHMATRTGLRRVALSGGVLQNRTLAQLLPAALIQAGLTPLCHRMVPANDACISLGQAAYGSRMIVE
ncbi:MAG: carbamoyltransferase HypF [Desulfovibrionaceae bacterium]